MQTLVFIHEQSIASNMKAVYVKLIQMCKRTKGSHMREDTTKRTLVYTNAKLTKIRVVYKKFGLYTRTFASNHDS